MIRYAHYNVVHVESKTNSKWQTHLNIYIYIRIYILCMCVCIFTQAKNSGRLLVKMTFFDLKISTIQKQKSILTFLTNLSRSIFMFIFTLIFIFNNIFIITNVKRFEYLQRIRYLKKFLCKDIFIITSNE